MVAICCLVVLAPMEADAFSSTKLSNNNSNKPAFVSQLHSATTKNDIENVMATSTISSSSSSSLSSTATISLPKTPTKSKKKEKKTLSWDWEYVVQQCWKESLQPVILFDGECGLCNGGVNFVLDMDTNKEFRFCSLSSKIGQSLLVAHGKDPTDRNSIILVLPEDNQNDKKIPSYILEKSEACMEIASKLEGAPVWLKAMRVAGGVAPTSVSDWFMQIIADNRYKFSGEYDQCRLDLDGEYEGRFLNDYEHEDWLEKSKETTSAISSSS